ncbi:hypothetical protein DFH09DRAFT_1331380 [Mycena vulgaris]|nr:hypothetical protein DFH09DRAFT_1331380 [Mycena vulgaris]
MVNASFSTLFILALAAVTVAVPIGSGDNKTWVVGRATPTPIAGAKGYSGPHARNRVLARPLSASRRVRKPVPGAPIAMPVSHRPRSRQYSSLSPVLEGPA